MLLRYAYAADFELTGTVDASLKSSQPECKTNDCYSLDLDADTVTSAKTLETPNGDVRKFGRHIPVICNASRNRVTRQIKSEHAKVKS